MDIKESRGKITELIIEADKAIQEKNYDLGLKIYQEALHLAEKIDWNERISFITENIHEINNKIAMKQRELQKKMNLEEERRKKAEELHRQEELQLQIKEKEEQDHKKHLETLKTKKEYERKLSQEAYDLLELGSNQLKAHQFEATFENYNKAKDIFKQIGWNSEISRIQELIDDAILQKKQIQEKTQREKEDKQVLSAVYQSREKELEESYLSSQQEISQLKQQILQTQQKSIKEKASSAQAFSLLDEANLLIQENNYQGALEKTLQAKTLFSEIGWQIEADRVEAQIELLKRKKEEYEKSVAEELEAQKKLLEAQSALELQAQSMQIMEEKKREDDAKKLNQAIQKTASAQKIANETFSLIEAIEREVKTYEIDVKKGKILEVECVYPKAIEVYRNAQQTLRNIEWNVQADNLEEGIIAYQDKIGRDQRLRKLEFEKQAAKKKSEQDFTRQIAISQKMQEQKDIEKKKLLQEEQEKARRSREEQDKCLALLDLANIALKDKKFENAIKIYEEVIEKYKQIGWNQGVQITLESLQKTKEEALKFQQEHIHVQKIQDESIKSQLERKGIATEQSLFSDQDKSKAISEHFEFQRKQEHLHQIQNEIFKLLEESDMYVRKNEYDIAIDQQQHVLQLLKEIEWPLMNEKVSDLMKDTENKKNHYLKQQQNQKDQLEIEEIERRLAQDGLPESERKVLEQDIRKRTLVTGQSIPTESTKKASTWNLLDLAESLVKQEKIFSALLQFHKAYINFNLMGWEREATTTKTRIVQILQNINPPLFDLGDLFDQPDINAEESLMSNLDEIISTRKFRKYDKTIEAISNAKDLIRKLKWAKSFNLIQIYDDFIPSEKRNYEEEQLRRQLNPSIENAMKLFDQAKVKAFEGFLDQAISLGQKAIQMYQSLGKNKEIQPILDQCARWQHDISKKEALEKREDHQPKSTAQANLTEEELRQLRIEERKRERRKELDSSK